MKTQSGATIRGQTCPVCLRQFGGRAACIYHASKSSAICFVNLMLFLPDLEDEERQDAEEWEAILEAAARARGEIARYSGILASQQEGPLKRMVVTWDSSRRSIWPLFQMYLSDPNAGRAIDFDHVKSLICAGAADEALEEVPIDLLGDCL